MYVCTVYSVLTPRFHISAHAEKVSAYNLLKIVHACNTDFTAANNLALLTFSQCNGNVMVIGPCSSFRK